VNSSELIKGVIDLRSSIVRIVGMRIEFNLGKVECKQFTVGGASRLMSKLFDGIFKRSERVTMRNELSVAVRKYVLLVGMSPAMMAFDVVGRK